MNYEKKYNEALAKARTFYKKWDGVDAYNSSLAISELKEIFPELKESEEEKLRKEMLQIAKESEDSFYMVLTPKKKETLISLLEKQGEQKTFNYESANIQQKDFGTEYDMHSNADKYFRPWNIKDVKDGNVLYSPGHNLLWIYKNKDTYHVASNLNYPNYFSIDGDIVIPSDVCLASKEQCDILFARIKKYGYTWDKDTKKLIY